MSANKPPTALQRLIPYMFLFVVGLAIFVPVMGAASLHFTDFGIHIWIAEGFPEKVTHVSHVMYHATYRLLKYFLPTIDSPDIALLAIMVFILPLPMIIFSHLFNHSAGTISVYVILLLSIALTIVAPITFWTSESMIGYINPVVYHNPTLIALRLFAIPVSLLALKVFSSPSYRDANHRRYTILLCASLLLFATQVKPSYTIVLIPGCCAFAAWRILRGDRVDWMLLVLGICIPGSLMLGLLYLISYVNLADGSTISFGVFVFTRYWIPDWLVPIKLLLSLAFPLSVYLLFSAEARKHLYLNLSWAVFATSALATYCLYESGPRIGHGNFLWNSYITVFVLMFASVQFLIQQYVRFRLAWPQDRRSMPSRMSLKFSISVVFFGAHVFFGIGYYIRFLMGIDMIN
ncbi:MAG: hypothetical protein OXG60_18760 [Chloroflexi bacterium]|nr:hypothetical protein [Chloroflexota bacterium]